MNSYSKTLLFLFFCISGTLCSCEEEAPKLTRAHRKIVDSLVQERRTSIREELDSLCDLKFAKEIKIKTDSIVEDRMAEIRKKIEADAK